MTCCTLTEELEVQGLVVQVQLDAILDPCSRLSRLLGWNTVEREGISVSHPARFILVGSGNPEEGELRPQLRDR